MLRVNSTGWPAAPAFPVDSVSNAENPDRGRRALPPDLSRGTGYARQTLVVDTPLEAERRGRGSGKRPAEHGPTGWTVGGSEISAMRPQDTPGNGEPQSRAPSLPVARHLAPVKRGEQVRQVVRGDPWPTVRDREVQSRARAMPA